MTDSEQRTKLITGLREFADFLEANPVVPTDYIAETFTIYVTTREQMADIARIGGWKKSYDNYFNLNREFQGGMKLQVYCSRDLVCRKIITGKRVVPAQPAQPAVDEHVEDIVEWICDSPLLKEESIDARQELELADTGEPADDIVF